VLIEVTSVEALDNFCLRLAFNDGAAGVVDVKPFLWGEQFEPLLDPARFKEVFLDEGMGTIAWPNHADLAPEALHERLESETTPVVAARSARFA
jgi:hypothetical protein